MLATALLPALAAPFASPRALLAASPADAFALRVPDDFVTLPARDTSTLLVAGNFRTGTTLSVQRVDATALAKALPPGSACDGEAAGALLCARSAPALADALAAYRDTQAAPSGARSEVLPDSVTLDAASGALRFEMTLALSTQLQGDLELARHTVVAALPSAAGGLLCLWAGAKASSWEAGDGPVLQSVAQTFALK